AAVASTNQTATSYQPGTLAYSTTYYWKVDAVGAGGTTAGPLWSFTTVAAPTPPPPPSNTTLGRLRVVDWNVALGYNTITHLNEYDVQVDMLASLKPDVVTLQEMSYSDADMMTWFVNGLSSRTGRQWHGYYQRG